VAGQAHPDAIVREVLRGRGHRGAAPVAKLPPPEPPSEPANPERAARGRALSGQQLTDADFVALAHYLSHFSTR